MKNKNSLIGFRLIINIAIITLCLIKFISTKDLDNKTTDIIIANKNINEKEIINELPKKIVELNDDYENFSENEFDVDEEDLVDDSRDSKKVRFIRPRPSTKNTTSSNSKRLKKKTAMRNAIRAAALLGLQAMVKLYEQKEPEMMKKGLVLEKNSPGAKLSFFSAPENGTEQNAKAAYAALETAKILKETVDLDFTGIGRQAPPRVSLRRTPLEGLCPPREPPRCLPASRRYRTHDGTCNNLRHPRWGSAQMPFHRFIHPEYTDGIESLRTSVTGNPLPSARFVSLLVHGAKDGDAPVTMHLAQWGQFIDHDMTATAQPRSINGTVPKCCDNVDAHPSCLPIKVPLDDPWLAPLGLRCLEFLRSAPSQRPDCILSWREQTNQATSYLDGSTIYSSNPRSSDNARLFHDGLLLFGRGPPREDVCLRGALANQCIRPGDSRSGEQPGLLAMHTVWVGEHNRISIELADLNSHWSDEKIYQEARRIVGAMIQHITFREFLPLVLGKDVCNLFDLVLLPHGYYEGYDPRINPTVANSFGAAAFRFGHSLVQGSFIRCDRNHNVLENNVTLHDEFAKGDTGGPGSLHRLIRGMATQRALKRDEFITPELTNHLFQTGSFPFGLDLAAINIQRGRDHGLPSYTSWRHPCGLSEINDWNDFEKVVGPRSMERIRQAYASVDDVDLFVGGLAERPVIGGLIGPTFACIIAQQFSNARKGDRFWYENSGFESSFTPAQLESVRQVSLAQVLCRALGGGTLQPNIFLPANVLGNERKVCGLGVMAPIDLLPWTERDPFNKNNEIVSRPFPNAASTIHLSSFSSEKKNPFKLSGIKIPLDSDEDEDSDEEDEDSEEDSNGIADKIDFSTTGQNSKFKTNKTGTVNNKLDFGPTQKPQLSSIKRPPTALVNNKLDIKRKPTSVLSASSNKITLTKRKPSSTKTGIEIEHPVRRTTTSKPPTKTTKKIRRKPSNKKLSNRRSDDKPGVNNDDDDDDDDYDYGFEARSAIKAFTNEDNATGYYDNKAVTTVKESSDILSSKTHTRGTDKLTNFNDGYDDLVDFKTNINDKNKNTNYRDDYRTKDEPIKRVVLSTPTPDAYSIEISIRPNGNRPYSTASSHYYDDYKQQYNTKRPEYNRPTYNNNRPQQSTYQPNYSYDIEQEFYSTNRPYYETSTDKPINFHSSTQYPYFQNPSKYTTPFSYDKTTTSSPNDWSIFPSQNFDFNNLPSRPSQSHNSYSSPNILRPLSNYYEQTTVKPQLQTFFIVETTKQTSPIPFFTTVRPQVPHELSLSNTYSNIRPNLYGNKFNSQYRNSEKLIDTSDIKLQRRIDETDDYDYSTYAPSYNENYNTDYEQEEKNQFDIDGYLRPDMMSYIPPSSTNTSMATTLNTTSQDFINITANETDKKLFYNNKLHRYVVPEEKTDTKETDNKNTSGTTDERTDDYVLPRLLLSKQIPTDETIFSTGSETQSKNNKLGQKSKINNKLDGLFSDTMQRTPLFDIHAIDYEEMDETEMVTLHTKTTDEEKIEMKIKQGISIVPLTILTRPERPDNWVMFDAPTKKPLPEIPGLENEKDLISSEIPKPLFKKD